MASTLSLEDLHAVFCYHRGNRFFLTPKQNGYRTPHLSPRDFNALKFKIVNVLSNSYITWKGDPFKSFNLQCACSCKAISEEISVIYIGQRSLPAGSSVMPVAGGSEGFGQDPDSGGCTFQASAAERAAPQSSLMWSAGHSVTSGLQGLVGDLQESPLTPVQVLGFIEAALDSTGISCLVFSGRCSSWWLVDLRLWDSLERSLGMRGWWVWAALALISCCKAP